MKNQLEGFFAAWFIATMMRDSDGLFQDSANL